jgi:hypothetical protein
MNFQRALARAKRIEDSLRETAFLPVPEQINGVTVRQFTLRHLTILTKIRSPFLVGGAVTGEDIGTFLWVVSPQYSQEREVFIPENRFRRWWMKLRGIQPPTVRQVFMAELVMHPRWQLFYRGIERYLGRVFMDKPPEVGGGKLVASSYAAGLIHQVARAYNWTPDQIMDTPLAAIFQLLKWSAVEANPSTPQFNPLQDRIKARLAT